MIKLNTKGINIAKARKNANLTMEELGKVVGVSRATIKRYESGEISNIPPEKIEKIAKATNVTESYLMGWDTLKKENALFHARILKDVDLLEMIKKYLSLTDDNKEIIKKLIDNLSNKKSG